MLDMSIMYIPLVHFRRNLSLLNVNLGLPHGSAVKNLPANAGDAGYTGSIPGSGRSPGGEDSNPLQYSCLETSMDRGAWLFVTTSSP